MPSSAFVSRRSEPDRDGSISSRWSRRTFLGAALSAVVLGAMNGCDIGSADDQQDFGAGGRKGGPPVAAGDDSGTPYVHAPPYTLNAQCMLSEDYFPVTYHQIDPATDTVVAYSRADGEVEAILLQDGTVSQIYRDPTTAGGWNVQPIDGAADVTSMVAGVSGPISGVPGSRATLKVLYTRNGDDQLYLTSEQPPINGSSKPTWSPLTTVNWASPGSQEVSPLQLTSNVDNGLLVTAMVPSSSAGADDARFYYWTDSLSWEGALHGGRQNAGPSWGFLSQFEYHLSADAEDLITSSGAGQGWAAVISSFNQLANYNSLTFYLPATTYSADPNNPSLKVWSYPLQSPGEKQNGTPYSSRGSNPAIPAGPQQPSAAGGPGTSDGGLQVFAIDFLTVLGSRFVPTAIVRATQPPASDNPGRFLQWVFALNAGSIDSPAWHWTFMDIFEFDVSGSAGPVQVATAITPSPDTGRGGVTSFLDLFLRTSDDSTLTVIRQSPTGSATKDATTPLYSSPIPLQTDVALMTSQAGLSTGNELVLVDGSHNVRALVRDPSSSAWTGSTIQLPSQAEAPLLQASAYRAELSLVDYWNAPVAGVPLLISVDNPVTALVDGAAYQLSTTPLAVPTDDHGQVVVALIADGLSTPTLTITTGGADPLAPTTVNPSGPINTYMKGGAGNTLNDQPPLDATSLGKATTDGTTSIFGASPDPDDLQDAVLQMSSAADAVPAAAAAGVAARRSTTLGRPTKTMTGTMQAVPVAVRLGPGASSRSVAAATARHGLDLGRDEQLLGSLVSTWFHDVVHGIKTAATTVSKVTVDAAEGLVTIYTTLKNGVTATISYTIAGLVDAAHVFHAALNKLGADIVKAVKWLEAEVVSLLKDSHQLAQLYGQWMDDLIDFITTQMKNTDQIDTWFASISDTIVNDFAAVTRGFGAKTTLTNLADNPPALSSDRRATTPRQRSTPTIQLDDSGTPPDPNQPHGNWLFTKVKSWISVDLQAVDNPELDTSIKTLIDDHKDDGLTAIGTVAKLIEGSILHPNDFGRLSVSTLLSWVQKLLVDVLDFFKGLLEALLDALAQLGESLKTMLDTPLADLGLFGKILDLIGVGSITFKEIICWLFAFPACLAYRVEFGGTGRPFPNVDPSAGNARTTTSARPRLGAAPDPSEGLKIAAGSALGVWAAFDAVSALDSANGGTPSKLFAIIDIASPIIVAFLTVPSGSGGNQPGVPYYSVPTNEGDRLEFAAWALGIIPALCVGIDMYLDKSKVSFLVPSWQVLLNMLTTACGVGAMVTGLVGASKTGGTGYDYAGAVLDNLANMMALCLSRPATDATEGVSAGIDAAATLICGWIGAAFEAEEK